MAKESPNSTLRALSNTLGARNAIFPIPIATTTIMENYVSTFKTSTKMATITTTKLLLPP